MLIFRAVPTRNYSHLELVPHPQIYLWVGMLGAYNVFCELWTADCGIAPKIIWNALFFADTLLCNTNQGLLLEL